MGTAASRGIAIASEHDSSAYTRVFQRVGRVHLSGFLVGADLARAAIAKADFARASSPPKEARYSFEVCPLEESSSAEALKPVTDLLTSEALAKFLRVVVNAPTARLTALTATRFRAGDYVVGLGPDEARHPIAAFSINLTRTWKPEWGGLHLFLDADGNVGRGLAPEFNSLTLFKLPQNQFVSQVADDAAEDRLTITGLLTIP